MGLRRTKPRDSDRRWFAATPDQLQALAEETDPEAVTVCWDTGHAHIAGLDQPRAIADLGPLLQAMHIQDNDGSADQHRLPYEGTIEWTPLLDTLRTADYRGAFNLEVGGAVHRTPLPLRPAKLRFALQLATAMAKLQAWPRSDVTGPSLDRSVGNSCGIWTLGSELVYCGERRNGLLSLVHL